MLLAVRISSDGCTWEVWRALKKLELLWAAPRATLTLLSCSPNFPRASITRYTHAKHEPIPNFPKMLKNHLKKFTQNCKTLANVLNGGIWRCLKRERDIGTKAMLSDVKTAFR